MFLVKPAASPLDSDYNRVEYNRKINLDFTIYEHLTTLSSYTVYDICGLVSSATFVSMDRKLNIIKCPFSKVGINFPIILYAIIVGIQRWSCRFNTKHSLANKFIPVMMWIRSDLYHDRIHIITASGIRIRIKLIRIRITGLPAGTTMKFRLYSIKV